MKMHVTDVKLQNMLGSPMDVNHEIWGAIGDLTGRRPTPSPSGGIAYADQAPGTMVNTPALLSKPGQGRSF